LAVDASNNVVVAVQSEGVGTSYDFLTIKYAGSNGVALWTNRFRAAGDDVVNALGLDQNGDVFVTGRSPGPNFYTVFTTIKYSSAGIPVWTNYYDEFDFSNKEARALAVDKAGDVYVTGTAQGGNTTTVTIKYSNAGVALWTNRYNGPISSSQPNAWPRAPMGMCMWRVIPPQRQWSGLYRDRLCERGLGLWTNIYIGPLSDFDIARTLAVSESGDIFVAGQSGNDCLTIKYSAGGSPLWTNRYRGPLTSFAAATAVVLGPGDQVNVAGSAYTATAHDFATVAYSSAGVALWTNRYAGPGNDTDYPYAAAVEPGGQCAGHRAVLVRSIGRIRHDQIFQHRGGPMDESLRTAWATVYDTGIAVARTAIETSM
jgi:hypothetical protein